MATPEVTGRAGPPIAPAIDVTGWLMLAATPTFAVMALISILGPPGMAMCSAASIFGPINDMALMYVLMSLFHLSPWLTLLSHRLAAPLHPITQTEGD
jgi:hypothetical protein